MSVNDQELSAICQDNRVNLDHLTIVLHKPRLAENIGATARAARNMGFTRLMVVQPEDVDQERMLKMATGSSAELTNNLAVKSNLAAALGSFHYIVGTTARLGGSYRQSPVTPRKLARQLSPSPNMIRSLYCSARKIGA